MNNLKLLGLTAGVGSLILAGSASADFQGISWTETASSYGNGTCYQIFVDVQAGDQVNAIYGDDSNALNISSDSGFYQHMGGSHTCASQTDFMLNLMPSLAEDSYVTIGLTNATGNAMLEIGIDWAEFNNNGGAIWTDNGSWFATPDDAQVYEVDGKVLIGCFTVADGDHVYGSISLQGKNVDDSNWTASGVAFDTEVIPTPGALALLGLAGLAARRRRK